jgi:hypothetical protein
MNTSYFRLITDFIYFCSQWSKAHFYLRLLLYIRERSRNERRISQNATTTSKLHRLPAWKSRAPRTTTAWSGTTSQTVRRSSSPKWTIITCSFLQRKRCHSQCRSQTDSGVRNSLGEQLDCRDSHLSRPNDVIIAVMGVTGTGKSAFIHHLAGHGVRIGHSLHSCKSILLSYSTSPADLIMQAHRKLRSTRSCMETGGPSIFLTLLVLTILAVAIPRFSRS